MHSFLLARPCIESAIVVSFYNAMMTFIHSELLYAALLMLKQPSRAQAYKCVRMYNMCSIQFFHTCISICMWLYDHLYIKSIINIYIYICNVALYCMWFLNLWAMASKVFKHWRCDAAFLVSRCVMQQWNWVDLPCVLHSRYTLHVYRQRKES